MIHPSYSAAFFTILSSLSKAQAKTLLLEITQCLPGFPTNGLFWLLLFPVTRHRHYQLCEYSGFSKIVKISVRCSFWFPRDSMVLTWYYSKMRKEVVWLCRTWSAKSPSVAFGKNMLVCCHLWRALTLAGPEGGLCLPRTLWCAQDC